MNFCRDVQGGLDQMSSNVNVSGSSIAADDLFSQLDSDGDGRITKQEFTDLVKKLTQHFQSARMQGAMPPMGDMGGMTPGPPPAAEADSGMSKEELASPAEAAGDSDSSLASLLTERVANFDAADANQDGKVTMQETIAYQSKSGSGPRCRSVRLRRER